MLAFRETFFGISMSTMNSHVGSVNILYLDVNSLNSRRDLSVQFFLGLKSVIFSPILVRSASQRHQNLAELFGYNHGILDLHTACQINDLSWGFVLGKKKHIFN